MMLANDASVKDMEAAAVAWVAELLHKPFLAVKVITDIVDGNIMYYNIILTHADH
jgi:5'-methylthioadenosine nucleosidase